MMDGTRRTVGHLLLLLGTLAAASGAQAGDWVLTNSITLESIFSDNIGLDEDGGSGVILDVSPNLDLRGEGRRVSGNVSYAPKLYSRFGDNDDTGINHYLDAALTTELVRDTLFLDTDASAGLVTVNAATNFGPDDLAYRDDVSQVYTLSVSPYAQHRFGSQANLSGRVGFNWLGSENGASSVDSTGLSAEVALSGGARFSRLPWSVRATASETRFDDRTDRREAINTSLGYRIDRQWRLDGGLGYERNDLSTARQGTDGAVYSAGVFWTPTPRTNVQAELGKRYFGTFWNVRANHRSRRTTLGLTASRDVSNVRALVLDQQFVDALADLGLSPQDYLNILAGLGVPQVLPVTLRNEDFLTTRVSFNAKISGRRTDVGLLLSWDDRSYEVSGDDEQVLRATISANRRITQQITARLRSSWQRVESSTSDDSDFLDLSLGLSRKLGRQSQLGVDVSRRQRFSDTAEEYTEHRLSLTFTTPMF